MKNYIGVGNRVTLTAAAVTTSGQPVLIGSLFGIAESAAAIGEPLVLVMNGIYDLTKTASQAWTVGQLIYWDVATSRVTNVVAPTSWSASPSWRSGPVRARPPDAFA